MKAAQTRSYILEKAAPLFNRRGFEGTSVADLEAATGLTKGALYGNFQGKEAIAEAAFTWSAAKVKTLLREELEGCASNKEKLSGMFDFFSRYVLDPPIPGGCPLLNAAVEADDHRISMRPVVTAELVQVVGFIATLIRKGVRSGDFRKGTNARSLAFTFFCALEGAIMFSRVEGSVEPMTIVVRHCKEKLDQISNSLWNKNA